MYVSIMGSGAAFGGTAPNISKARNGRLKIFRAFASAYWVWFKERKMDEWEIRSAGLGLVCACMGWEGRGGMG
jgi:hypothetical protein